MSPQLVGMYIGLGSAVGAVGVTFGILGDWLKQLSWETLVGLVAVVGTAPLVIWMIYTESLMMAFFLNFAHHLFSACWPGIPPSTATDLVMPRMRAVAGAYYILINTMIGLAMGPYVMGQLSDVYAAGGMESAEALRSAIMTSMSIFALTLVFLFLAWKNLPKDESTRLERAREHGEDVGEMTGDSLDE